MARPDHVFGDTSFFFACLEPLDTYHQRALEMARRVMPTLRMAEYGSRLRVEAEEVFRQYGRERRLSLCDAISFVVITTLLDRPPCLTFDDDFRALGLTVVT